MFRTALLFFALLIISATAGSDEFSRDDEILDLGSELPGGDFTLQSSQGKFSLNHLRGKVVLLYFGYTMCPDVCPTSLAIIAQALNELSSDEVKSVQAVFVSVDPKRDNVQILAKYASYFHPNIIGVTGSESEIAEVAKRYGVQYKEVAIGESGFGYAVDHSAETYLISQRGDLRFIFPHKTPSFVILEAIRYLLAGNL